MNENSNQPIDHPAAGRNTRLGVAIGGATLAGALALGAVFYIGQRNAADAVSTADTAATRPTIEPVEPVESPVLDAGLPEPDQEVEPVSADAPVATNDPVAPPADAESAEIPAAVEEPVVEPVVDEPVAETVGLGRICLIVDHGIEESDVRIRGEIRGLKEGVVVVEGETLNDGERVEIPVSEGLFDGLLPIRSFGEHRINVFEATGPGAADQPIDLLGTLATRPGNVIPVGDAEGPVFDSECFDFDEFVAPVGDVASEPSDDTDAPDEDVPVLPSSDDRIAQLVDDMLDAFVVAHVERDVPALLDSLHPLARVSFGEEACADYVERTTGSIAAAEVLSIGEAQQLNLDTPAGPIGFETAVPFTVEFTLTDGSTFVNDAFMPFVDDMGFWLTNCGVEAP